jgi:hypothetical protein
LHSRPDLQQGVDRAMVWNGLFRNGFFTIFEANAEAATSLHFGTGRDGKPVSRPLQP